VELDLPWYDARVERPLPAKASKSGKAGFWRESGGSLRIRPR